jgi:outer membrane protein insertion porin family
MRSGALERYQLSYFEPYLTDEGIGIGYDIQHTKLDAAETNLASYLSSTDAFDIYLGVPISESDSINVQMGLGKTGISTFPGLTPPSIVDYIDNLGHRTFHSWNMQLSWAHDTRNRYWNPTRGGLQQVSLEVTLPGSTVQYYKAQYHFAHYLRMTDALTFYGHASVGYGDSYNDPKSVLLPTHERYVANISGLPFFENFYAGGARSVRGFRDNTLGPREAAWNSSYQQVIGGAVKTIGSLEMFFPTLLDSPAARVSAFVDFGNVFKDVDAFDAGELRASAGVALMWRAPVGPISISYAMPLRKEDGDEVERLQFTFGGAF